MGKIVKVILERHGNEDWAIHVNAKSVNQAIAKAFQSYTQDGHSTLEVTNIRTTKPDSVMARYDHTVTDL